MNTIYSGHKCPPCKHLKEMLEKEQLDYNILYVPEDISVADFFNLGMRTTPSMITHDGERIANSMNILNYLRAYKLNKNVEESK